MQKEEKKYFNEGLDGDTQDFLVGANAYVNGKNFRFATTDKGAVGGLENVLSTRAITHSLPAGTNDCIGAVADEAKNRAIFFNWNSNGNHGIYCYDKGTDTVYTVLLNSQITGGLNFSKDWLIHSSNVVDNILYWVNDHINQPRRLNIEAGIKLNHPGYVTSVLPYTSPLKQAEVSLIRKPPAYPITFVLSGGSNPGNFIRNSAFQFAYRYVYRDYELSVLSEYSRTAGFLLPSDLGNAYLLTIPVDEAVNNDVLKIELVVKDLESNKYFIIKTWDKGKAGDAAAITAHNAGTPLTFMFYNDQNGIAISDADAAELFHSIPIYSRTQEVAKNRLWLGNNVRGLTASEETSLVAYPVQDEGGVLTGRWWRLKWTTGLGVATKYVIDITGIPTSGYYSWTSGYIDPVSPVFPVSVNFGDLVFEGAGATNVFAYNGIAGPPYATLIEFSFAGGTSIVNSPPAVSSLVGKKVHKSGAGKRVAIAFYDFAGRLGGAVTKEALKLITPDRQYGTVAYTRFITWSVSNIDALSEIPEWATSYSILTTKCLRTRSFFQIRAENMGYATKDGSGNYIFTSSAWAATHLGIGINLAGLKPPGLGYVFSEGDFVKVYIGTNVYELVVIDQSGDWIIANLSNLGTLNSGTSALVEVYTPFKENLNELFFEVGNRYPVLDPGLPSRRYSTMSGDIEGDVWLIERTKSASQYLVEAMSPNDKLWTIWNTDAGRAIARTGLGQELRDRNICFSNVFQQGTQVNGLSNFDVLDYQDLPIESGPITKLKLTSKTQDEGSVMLAICKYDVSSIYIGEAQINQSNGATAFFSKADGVIGTINPLKGGYGSVNPESVCMTDSELVFWWDMNKEKYVFYSLNGVTAVSDNKLTRFFRQFCRQYNSMTKAQIEALGSRPFIVASQDPHHKEVLVTVPTLLADNPRGMTDVVGLDYPYDIWDGQAKTLVYKYPMDSWHAPMGFLPEYYVVIGNDLYSFKDGKIHQHNAGPGYNNFYGVPQKSRIAIIGNQEQSLVKIWESLAIECNLVPDYVHLRTESPNVQSSDLVNDEFRSWENIWYAGILRDRLTPTLMNKTVVERLHYGDNMRGPAIRILLEWDVNTAQNNIQIKFVNLTYIDSQGYKL